MKKEKDHIEQQNPEKSGGALKILAIVLSTLAVLLVLLTVAVGVLFWYTGSMRDSMFSARDDKVVKPTEAVEEKIQIDAIDADWIDENGNAYNYRDDVISILLMGIDYMANEEKWEEGTLSNGGNADVLALVILDTKTFDFDILYIPRDTIAEVIAMDPEGNYIDTISTNISTSHSYGDGGDLSCQLTADAVSGLLLGAPVNRYAALHCDAIYSLNEILGGVRITFDSDCTELHPSFKQGNTVKLNNLYFSMLVTYRDYDNPESASIRGLRIMNVLKAMFDQLKERIMENPTVALEIFNELLEYITTDLELSEITYLARNIRKMDFTSDTVIRLPGETVLGEEYAEFHADQDWIYDFVVEKFCVPVE